VKSPDHLTDHSRDLWEQLTGSLVLEPTELELLRLALEALDRCEQARTILVRDGIVATNRYGALVAHPCVAIERDSRIAAARIFRDLALPEAPAEVVSPLALRRRRAAG
jgi:P27 family predicted phage terminase small subunit